MKKAAVGSGRPLTKAKASPKTVDEYLAGLPRPARITLKKVRAAIRSAVPAEATETISYRMPAFRHKGILVWYAAFADHWSFFPTASVLKRFAADLEGYSTSKGTLRLPMDQPPPIALIKRIVRARVIENEGKTRR